MNKFSKEIRAHRRYDGVGLREAAKRAGISTSTFSRVENGYAPDVFVFRALVRWAEMDACEALDLLGPRPIARNKK